MVSLRYERFAFFARVAQRLLKTLAEHLARKNSLRAGQVLRFSAAFAQQTAISVLVGHIRARSQVRCGGEKCRKKSALFSFAAPTEEDFAQRKKTRRDHGCRVCAAMAATPPGNGASRNQSVCATIPHRGFSFPVPAATIARACVWPPIALPCNGSRPRMQFARCICFGLRQERRCRTISRRVSQRNLSLPAHGKNSASPGWHPWCKQNTKNHRRFYGWRKSTDVPSNLNRGSIVPLGLSP